MLGRLCRIAALGTLSLLALGMIGCGSERDAQVRSALVPDGTPLERLPLRDGDWSAATALDAQAHDATPADRPNTEEDAAESDTGASRRSETLTSASGLSVAGQSTVADDARVDGVSAQQFFRDGPRGSSAGGVHSGSTFAEGAIRSLRSGPASFSADAGGTGEVVQVESHRAEEGLHGAVSGILRESAWAATNPFAVVSRYTANGAGYTPASVRTFLTKPNDALGQLALSAGGEAKGRVVPARVRGRLGAFASIEEQWRSNPAESAAATGSFFALSATPLALLGTRGVSAKQTDTALGYLDSLMGPVGRSSSRVLGFLRVDAAVSKRDEVFAAWTHNRFNSPAGTQFASPSEAVVSRGRGSVGDERLLVQGVTAAWTHRFAAHLAIDLRGQWVSDAESETPRLPLPQEPAISPGGYAPEVRIAPNGFSYGTPSTLEKAAYPDETRTELVPRMQWMRGQHLVQFGGDWSRVEDLVAGQPGTEGSFLYESGTTGGKAGGLVDWITDYALGVNAYPNAGCPSVTAAVHRFCFHSYTQRFGDSVTDWTTHLFSAFTQDTWRITQGVSVTAGVRWEYELLPLPQNANAVLDANLLSVVATGDVRAGTTASFPEDRNNFGPRLAASWAAPLGVTVQAGYGLFFGRIPGAMIETALAQNGLASGVREARITPTTETICPQQPATSFGYPCAYTNAPPAAVAETATAVVFSQNFRVPWIERMSLTAGHGIGKHAELSVGYAGARGTQLPGVVDLNIAPSATSSSFVLQGGDGRPGARDGETFSLPLYASRLIAQYGPVDALVSAANASYDALAVVGHGEWHGVQVRGSYAWSHADDYSPLPGATPSRMTQLDPFRNGYDKARSTLDVTHRFIGSIVGQSQWTHGGRWVSRMLSGWRIAAIGSAGSGMPYSYRIFGGTYLSGGSDTINGSGGATYLPTSGRNTLRLPVRGGMDLRIGRGLSLGARWHGEAFAEAFNVLNERNLTAVETQAYVVGTAANGVTPLVFQDAATIAAEGVSTPPFGSATSSTSGLSRERQVEIGFRLTY